MLIKTWISQVCCKHRMF